MQYKYTFSMTFFWQMNSEFRCNSCLCAVKDARSKIKIQDTVMSQKLSVQVEVLSSF